MQENLITMFYFYYVEFVLFLQIKNTQIQIVEWLYILNWYIGSIDLYIGLHAYNFN